jgi:hypothetical protein
MLERYSMHLSKGDQEVFLWCQNIWYLIVPGSLCILGPIIWPGQFLTGVISIAIGSLNLAAAVYVYITVSKFTRLANGLLLSLRRFTISANSLEVAASTGDWSSVLTQVASMATWVQLEARTGASRQSYALELTWAYDAIVHYLSELKYPVPSRKSIFDAAKHQLEQSGAMAKLSTH